MRRPRGFTLIELLVVMTLIGIATAAVSLALRDPGVAQLEREGERLITLLEIARAEARANALAVHWQPQVDGARPLGESDGAHFKFVGLPPAVTLPRHWSDEPPVVQIEGQATALILGPEPLIPAQAVRLRRGDRQLRIATDGLKPFASEWIEAPQ
ncbi:prepilin-type N-terminal cleavage/methylation domain-containing protein [Inhella gelatinilytica]|uniref:Prepilin-type N-terminal cleavage/methylation domain-containing protein n=1 Tax=Inhella gelatinilytica TaxID=2795030 RepID=A0A931IYM9_9BURK|nr:prepilin-type N-terminal cleavage/methylation domain-containing protein [Inhella gelatinilytica]MBH9552413.1 prepilin-type N-terminal cleavage/methylation domain-containing protein [Inhella gelatinilytica]